MAQYGVKKALEAMLPPVAMPYQKMIVPVTLELPSTNEGFTLPLDPLVSVSGKNDITCRNVARYDGEARGSIKEKWRTGDWNITIAGILIADQDTTIDQYVYRLRQFVEADENIKIICPYINDGYDITRIVIESYDFPFTKGEGNQTYTLNCKSDDVRTSLLL
jgi:hypothetical protein